MGTTLQKRNPFTGNEDPIEEFIYHSNLIEREYGKEAFNDAMDAWRYGLEHRTKISIEMILGIHRHLMKRIDPQIAGQLRDCDVFIGGNMIPFVSKHNLKNQLGIWLREFDPNQGGRLALEKYDFSKEKYAKEMHVKFEKIHPFLDGNGRTGRILYNIHRLLLELPIHIIHEGLEQHEYYRWFNN